MSFDTVYLVKDLQVLVLEGHGRGFDEFEDAQPTWSLSHHGDPHS